MEYIKSKDIFLLVRDTLKIVYPRLMKHGSRVAYMVYTMLREEGKYEEFELADMVMVATLHDIGAYKTERDKLGEILRYESKDCMAHSIYGYLFFKYLSPVPDLAKVIMYHHTDYDRLKQMNYIYKDVAAYINIAEKMDHYSTALGDKFEMGMFQKYAGNKLSDDGLFLFYKCEDKYGMFEKIRSGAYLKELDDIIEYMIFNNEDKKKFLEMLMYCQGFFRSEMVVETAMAVCISEEIAREMSLPQQKREILHYGTLLHDIGMLSIPRELIETPRKLEPKEAKLVKTHVETAGKILGLRMKKEVVDIVLAHHERCDGSGYPRQLTDSQMSTEQKILQVTDMVVALLHKRSYRKPLPKEKIIAILEEKTSRNVLKRQVVSVVVQSYDKIMSRIGEESAQILRMYETLNKQYELISKKYNI
ncbi:MAG: HD domain-containing protein [Lachnospiraceae bacterium]|nr:HD domain-containing protein [Lachnospiraceae bacterium]